MEFLVLAFASFFIGVVTGIRLGRSQDRREAVASALAKELAEVRSIPFPTLAKPDDPVCTECGGLMAYDDFEDVYNCRNLDCCWMSFPGEVGRPENPDAGFRKLDNAR